MSERSYSRRAVTIGGGIAAALGIAAIGVTVPRLFRRHYAASPYDDLFAKLIDRDAALPVGHAALEQWNGKAPTRTMLAATLRPRLERRTLAEVSNAELAQGNLREVQGWVLPESLVLLCVLAALER